jgi:curved DNA-binding protein CbpA
MRFWIILFYLFISSNGFGTVLQFDASQNYYGDLELPRGASIHQVKAAYRKLAIRYHPNSHSPKASAEAFRRVNEAYVILTDNETKSAYDSLSRNDSVETLASSDESDWVNFNLRMNPNDDRNVAAYAIALSQFSLDEMLKRSGRYEKYLAVTALELVEK